MDSDEVGDKIFHIFKDFMARVAKLDKLEDAGSSLLAGFRQALGLLQRPPPSLKSKLVDDIIKANETKRLSSYIAAGCINNHDMVKSMSTLHTCLLGLQDHLCKAKDTLAELESLMEDVSNIMQTKDTSLAIPCGGKYSSDELDQTSTACQDEAEFFNNRDVETTDYGILMAIIYNMLKQNHVMQERIVTSLDLKKFSGEAEGYSHMWGLRPFVDYDIMHQAWMLIP